MVLIISKDDVGHKKAKEPNLLSKSGFLSQCRCRHRSWTNFTIVFMPTFYVSRSQMRKKLFDLTVFLALLGSACIKAARKMLVKLTLGFGSKDCATAGSSYTYI